MGNRTAKFISTLVASIIAGAPLAAVSQNAPGASSSSGTASAAADCLASPKGTAPQGQHWHYRLDRATKRQCWYLRAEAGKDGAKAVQSAQATADTPTADSAAPQPHPVQDARAEYVAPQSAAAPVIAPVQAATATPAPAQPAASPSPEPSAQQPATTWPDPSTSPTASPAPQPAPVATAGKAAKAAAPVALATADSSAEKPTGSLQMLLLVIGGALALAGILASVIYRFAGARVHVQADRRGHWDDWEPQEHEDSRAPWRDAMPAPPPRAPIDFDAVRPHAPLAALEREIAVTEADEPSAVVKAPDAHEVLAAIPRFERAFEIVPAAPQRAASESGAKQPDDHEDTGGRETDAVDIDVITSMLERLAQQGPRLSPPSLEADLADFARIPRGRSAARA